MSDFQSIIQAIKTQIQQQAQAALPVVPNNGNPQGANNMPAVPMPNAVSAPMGPDWAQPSQAMAVIQQMLAQPLQTSKAPAYGFPNETTAPLLPAKEPAYGFPNETTAPLVNPVLPMRNIRQQMRADGDFSMMPKRGHAYGQVMPVGQQELMRPVVPIRRQGF